MTNPYESPSAPAHPGVKRTRRLHLALAALVALIAVPAFLALGSDLVVCFGCLFLYDEEYQPEVAAFAGDFLGLAGSSLLMFGAIALAKGRWRRAAWACAAGTALLGAATTLGVLLWGNPWR
ncbi:MAG: hypothetical protein GXY83_06680 [Rhodopirellula sp.]|nr:hypothetical protein [Rhodopirellula sp.]